MDLPRESVEDVLRKHGARIEEQIETDNFANVNYSQNYIDFKREMAPELSRYEKFCKSLGSVVKLNISESF